MTIRGVPKDAIFGGFRRARISSQCIKRAIRDTIELPDANNAVAAKRSTQHAYDIAKRLQDEYEKDFDQAHNVGRFIFQKMGLKEDRSGRLTVMQFFGNDEINQLTKTAADNWDLLVSLANKDLRWEELAQKIEGYLGSDNEHTKMLGRLIAEAKAGKANATTLESWLSRPQEDWDLLLNSVNTMDETVPK